MAPLLAADHPVAGVVIWGGGARTWFERQLAFERRAMELEGVAPAEFRNRMDRIARFYSRYLLEGQDPAEIERADPDLHGLWGHLLVGTEGITQYGRPFAFHRQAQRQDWAGAWGRVSVPVLILEGRYDWYEDAGSAQLVADIVNAHTPGRARLEIIPGLDHHFVRYPSAAAAFRECGGQADPTSAVAMIRDFLVHR